ncbi:cell adhesion molecule CEACAM1-like isoform X2 [Engystomops pustulosus]|uniref:cell adhesion molecule CEACAM1-like isoform X2 n=1 Tax=Engystomops pustulosus TaxID=76066 RepID=UPI003AFADE61
MASYWSHGTMRSSINPPAMMEDWRSPGRDPSSYSTRSDSGNYTVTVTSAVIAEGSGTMVIPVKIYDPVTGVSVSQSPAAVDETSPAVNLSCSASSGGMTYTWMREGQSLVINGSYVTLDGGRILQINHPNRTYSGDYSCNVSNPVSWGVASWTLKIPVLKVLTTSSGQFLVGKNIYLSITYTSSQVGIVSWKKDGNFLVTWYKTIIDQSSDYTGRLEIAGNGSLTIYNSTRSDSGDYSVTVTSTVDGEGGGALNVPVKIYDPVTGVSVSQSPAAVDETSPAVNLSCSASSGGMTYTWMREGQSLVISGSYVTLDGGRILQINHPNKAHSGDYSCNVSNPVSWGDASWTLRIKGQDPAALTVQATSSGDFLVGKAINLSISYTSSQVGIVTWSKDGVLLVTWYNEVIAQAPGYDGRLEITGKGTLIIYNSTWSDSGNYTVTVTSTVTGEGSRTMVIPVKIYDPVTNVSVSQSPAAVDETSPAVNLSCSASSGGMTYTWMREGQSLVINGKYVTSDGGRILQINYPKRTNSRKYSCNVSNPVSWEDASWRLSVSCPESEHPLPWVTACP